MTPIAAAAKPPQCCALSERMLARCPKPAEWHILADGEQPEMHVDACDAHLVKMLGDARTSTVSRYVDGDVAR